MHALDVTGVWQKAQVTYCKSTIFGRYKIWRLGKSGPIWHTLIWLLGSDLKSVYFQFSVKSGQSSIYLGINEKMDSIHCLI